MLVLSRRKGEQIVLRLGEATVLVQVVELRGRRVRIGVTAPQDVSVFREELCTEGGDSRDAARRHPIRLPR